MNKLISTRKMRNAHNNYRAEKQNVEKLIQDSADFSCSIEFQPSDGFVIVDDYGNNGMLERCLLFIKKKGVLAHTDYLKTCI